ncbi:MAG: histidinol dehydrogenase, partial [Kamptonema sp. SIO4C4]|nr:histidinol dehydrogenase [Kamptonema sp. SIO4C4]
MTATSIPKLKRVPPEDVRREIQPPVDQSTLAAACIIIDQVRDGGVDAIRTHAERFGERKPDEPLVLGRPEMREALASLSKPEREVLERAAGRIRAFAQEQRDAIQAVDVAIPGGRAGHSVEPIQNAGCYAPAGRYPLPSSVLI